MRIVEVTDARLARQFLLVPVQLLGSDPNYIRPLDKDVEQVFDKTKNKAFRFGEATRWLLQNEQGRYIGRIAAYVSKRYKNKGDEQPTGCFGFFDCIDDQAAANLLLDTARDWLAAKGMEAMDGPVNFGERNYWWGLLVEGFDPPPYGMNYNAPYYKNLLEQYGCQVFFYQNCYSRPVQPRLSDKFYRAHERFAADPAFSVQHARKSQLDKYAADFCEVYNKAWASHEGNKSMSLEMAKKTFATMKPVMDEELVWFAYHDGKPVAMYLSLPDLNEAFRYLNGRFDWWGKLKFVYYRWRGVIKKFTGIVFGVVPEFQGTGIDYYMIVEAAKVIQPSKKYYLTELQWQGDFNPKMNNISKNLEFNLSRRLATYRYLFDRSKPFKRHPIL
ncbi:MAG: hypothetical protein MUF62_00860 [Chitinophagaceae bacterium]|nr:hypothetical protein [Chitinophagaceae bacterium]